MVEGQPSLAERLDRICWDSCSLPYLKTRLIPVPLPLQAFRFTQATFLSHHFPLAAHTPSVGLVSGSELGGPLSSFLPWTARLCFREEARCQRQGVLAANRRLSGEVYV